MPFLSSRLSSVWKTPLGYILLYLTIIFGDIVSLSFVLPTIAFVVGSGWLFKSFIDDMMNEMPHSKCYMRISRRRRRWRPINPNSFLQYGKTLYECKRVMYFSLSFIDSSLHTQILIVSYFVHLEWLKSLMKLWNSNFLLFSCGVCLMCLLCYCCPKRN